MDVLRRDIRLQDGAEAQLSGLADDLARLVLIAHTRQNARFVFREKQIGSLEVGKLADLVVLDRDYLTVPADDIRNIASVLTMVGGRVVYAEGGLQAALGGR